MVADAPDVLCKYYHHLMLEPVWYYGTRFLSRATPFSFLVSFWQAAEIETRLIYNDGIFQSVVF